MSICTHTHTLIYLHIFVCIYIYLYISICIYVCICTYTLQVYPAVCLHVNGDCVEFAPDALKDALHRRAAPHTCAEVAGVQVHGINEASIQTEIVVDDDDAVRAYYFSHLSTVSQVERLLNEAEEVLMPYQQWPSMTATGWVGKVDAKQLPSLGLAGAKKKLRAVRAILDGKAEKSMSQVKVLNLPTDAQHQEVKELVLDVCGFAPVSVSLKLDRDFLHPADRLRLAPSIRNENMTGFITVSCPDQQREALQLDGHLLRGCRLAVKTVPRADAKALQHDGEHIVTLAHRLLTLVSTVLRILSLSLSRRYGPCGKTSVLVASLVGCFGLLLPCARLLCCSRRCKRVRR